MKTTAPLNPSVFPKFQLKHQQVHLVAHPQCLVHKQKDLLFTSLIVAIFWELQWKYFKTSGI